MSSFVPSDGDIFPVVELGDSIYDEAIHENLAAIISEQLPTDFQQAEDWFRVHEEGFRIKDLPTTLQHIEVLGKALELFGQDARYLFDMFLSICEKVSLQCFHSADVFSCSTFYHSQFWNLNPTRN